MERIIAAVLIVILLFILGRLGSKLSSNHTKNKENDTTGGVTNQDTGAQD